jgi:hypothetical protein
VFVASGKKSHFNVKVPFLACSFGRFAPVFRTFLGIAFCLAGIGSSPPDIDQEVCCINSPTSGSLPRVCILLFSYEKSFRLAFKPKERHCLM